MFLMNLGYKWKIPSSVNGLKGIVLLPAGNHSARLARVRVPDVRRILFDPQLYLASLRAADCTKACARLATYEWFGAKNIAGFDSGLEGMRDWERGLRERIARNWLGRPPEGDEIHDAISSAIEFQVNLGCSHVILPSPLLTEREDEAQTQAEWIEAGVNVLEAMEVGQPVLATAAISEGVINEAAFEPAGFLDTIADQLTARPGIDGVYLVIVQTHSGHPFDTSAEVHRAYLHLTQRFVEGGVGELFVNFADIFGFACMAVGARGFATSESQKFRRMSLENFRDDGGGRALPYLYSHRMATEFLSERHVNPVVNAKLLPRLKDVTEFSEPLFTALERGETASSVPMWAESQNNLAASHKHFIQRLILEDNDIARRKGRRRLQKINEWLTEASANQLLLAKRIDWDEPLPRLAPVGDWFAMLSAPW